MTKTEFILTLTGLVLQNLTETETKNSFSIKTKLRFAMYLFIIVKVLNYVDSFRWRMGAFRS